MFPEEGLATTERISGWGEGRAWKKAGARQVDQLPHSCPGTPKQGQQSLAPPREGTSPRRRTPTVPSELGARWAVARHSANQLSFQQQAPTVTSPHCLTQWKLFKLLSFWTKCFGRSLWKHSLLIFVCCVAFKKNEALSWSDCTLHTNYALHFHGFV